MNSLPTHPPLPAEASIESFPPPRAVYVHVPFCLHHCGYCDFTVVANRDSLIPAWLEALGSELRQCFPEHESVASPRAVDSVFIGGGTPTHLSPDYLEQLLRLISDYFVLTPNAEYSVEANPDGLSDQKLSLLKTFGVNRLSLGVQSFDDACLQLLERTHTASAAADTVARCCQTFNNVSVDLIFGVPGQTLQAWHQTLQIATSLPVQHVSTYGLTFEQGTPFFRRETQGQLMRLPDDQERQFYLDGIAMLKERGFEHYEVSNSAKPGFRCRHNQTYWRAEPYFAFGPGAARYVNGVRSTSCRSVVRWLKAWQTGRPCIEESESLNLEDRARESIMLSLRMIEGVHLKAFEDRYGSTVEALAGDAVRRHLNNGLLQYSGDYLRLTQDGLLLADSVVVDFL